MLGSLMAQSYEPPMNTVKFTEWLQWVLGEKDDVKLENHGIGNVPEHMYSADSKISESIYKFCDGGARFTIAITQLSQEDDEDYSS